jgi:hypothetical protein
MGTQPSELYELRKLTELTVYYDNEQIVFITKIPLVTDIELTLYNAIPVPITEVKENKTKKVIISTENPYIAKTKDRRHFTTFTEVQLGTCKDNSIFRVCNPYQQENNGQQSCEVELFNKPELVPKTCKPLVTVIDRNIYHKLRYQNEWIYSVINDNLVISCTEIQEPQIHRIAGEGIIKIIDNSCTITGKNVILTAIDTITKDIHADFIPRTNMKELFNLIPERVKSNRKQKYSNKKELKLEDLHGVSQSLDDIEELINVEEERQHNCSRHKPRNKCNVL